MDEQRRMNEPTQMNQLGNLVKNKARRKRYTDLKLPDNPRFKLKFWWKDGNATAHFSFDSCNKIIDDSKINFRDEQYGLSKLLRMIERQEYQGKFICCIIFATLDQVPQRVREGQQGSNFNINIYQKNGVKPGRFIATPEFIKLGHSTLLKTEPLFNRPK